MELAGVLSNPEFGERLGRITKAVAGLKPKPGAGVPALPEPPPAQGQVLRAIKAVLANRPQGLRTIEVWSLVAARLGRDVPSNVLLAIQFI